MATESDILSDFEKAIRIAHHLFELEHARILKLEQAMAMLGVTTTINSCLWIAYFLTR